jgi:hypothetical protein
MTLSTRSPVSEVLAALRTRFKSDSFWSAHITELETRHRSSAAARIHVAVFVEPYLSFLLDGTKTVESRFSVNRCAPFQRAAEGDLILVKRSGGGIVAVCEIASKWYYELDHSAWSIIKERFAVPLAVRSRAFWDERENACYASLFKVRHLRVIDPLPFEKRDRRGWVVLNSDNAAQGKFFDL